VGLQEEEHGAVTMGFASHAMMDPHAPEKGAIPSSACLRHLPLVHCTAAMMLLCSPIAMRPPITPIRPARPSVIALRPPPPRVLLRPRAAHDDDRDLHGRLPFSRSASRRASQPVRLSASGRCPPTARAAATQEARKTLLPRPLPHPSTGLSAGGRTIITFFFSFPRRLFVRARRWMNTARLRSCLF
jgi:hypothetical protein